MTHFASPKWTLFTSRPTSLLKRDFLKWAYFSVGLVAGFRLTKLLAIGNAVEMDVFVDTAEHAKNLKAAERQFRDGRVRAILRECEQTASRYRPTGKDPAVRSMRAMRELGGSVIYTYYVEWYLGPFAKRPGVRSLLIMNAALRDVCARILYPLLDEAHAWLAKQYSADIDWMLYRELTTVPSAKTIAERKRFHVFIGNRQRSTALTGSVAHAYLARENFSKVSKRTTLHEITGIAAGYGKVSGRVKIVRTVADLRNCKGKVVVSPDIIIEYTPYLKKNLAIVTDLGGLSSHAATVAREFNIPCVVGTKVATKVLKDGDFVEVDAVDGIVRIIKRSLA